MFGWFRKAKPPHTTAEPSVRAGADALVAFLHAHPSAGDDRAARHLARGGFRDPLATKLIQFVPIAFTRFLYRSSGVRFAPDYVVLGPDGQPKVQRPVADEPAYRAAWAHCEEAAAGGAGEAYFTPVAARSGGYRALQDLVDRGSNLAGIITSPPMMHE